MEHIINYSEEELAELKEELKTKLSQMKKEIFRKKLKLIGKSLLKLTLIVGGVAVTIIFPSAILIAVLGGVVAVIEGAKGTTRSVRKTKQENKRRKSGRGDLKEVEGELTKKKTVREFFQQQKQPSAPPLYPGLS